MACGKGGSITPLTCSIEMGRIELNGANIVLLTVLKKLTTIFYSIRCSLRAFKLGICGVVNDLHHVEH